LLGDGDLAEFGSGAKLLKSCGIAKFINKLDNATLNAHNAL